MPIYGTHYAVTGTFPAIPGLFAEEQSWMRTRVESIVDDMATVTVADKPVRWNPSPRGTRCTRE